MLNLAKQFFDRHLKADASDTEQGQEHTIQVAAAALLVEVGRADFDVSPDEEAHIQHYIQQTLGVDDAELGELVVAAKWESENSTSMHEFTRLIHAEYTLDQKRELMRQLWRVALADGRIDRYEDYVLRKIAELLYLSHEEFIRARLDVEGRAV